MSVSLAVPRGRVHGLQQGTLIATCSNICFRDNGITGSMSGYTQGFAQPQ